MFRETGRDSGRVDELGKRVSVLLLRLLDAPFHVANGVQVLVKLGTVALPQFATKFSYRLSHGVENAPLLLQPGQTRSHIRAPTITEQPLNDPPLVVFHRQWCRCAAPAQRTYVILAKTRLA